jgi:hypothetical protein
MSEHVGVAVGTPVPESGTLAGRLKDMWMSGDYGHFAQYLAPSAGRFFKRLGVTPGTRVLDVACGAGQQALMAARDGADALGRREHGTREVWHPGQRPADGEGQVPAALPFFNPSC